MEPSSDLSQIFKKYFSIELYNFELFMLLNGLLHVRLKNAGKETNLALICPFEKMDLVLIKKREISKPENLKITWKPHIGSLPPR